MLHQITYKKEMPFWWNPSKMSFDRLSPTDVTVALEPVYISTEYEKERVRDYLELFLNKKPYYIKEHGHYSVRSKMR